MTDLRLPAVDVVVVGLGVAGSIVCKELASTGLKIVGLERGRMIDPQSEFAMPYAHDELRYDRHSDLLQDLSRETLTFRNRCGQTALPMREMGSFKPGECVGGAGIHWGAHARRFLPWDFETRSRVEARYGSDALSPDCTSQDWGLTYDELEPYYDQFEQIYGIGGKAGNLDGIIESGGNPFEGRRSREFPNPPSTRTFAGTLFADAASDMGLTPFQNPTAAMTRAYTNLYRLTLGQCVRGGFCNSHGCAMGAKASPLTAVIPSLAKHANVELRARCNVLRVELDDARRTATGVTYADAQGRRVHQPAGLVVIASYTFNNTRLLLLSGIGEPYDPSTGRGVVGRNYSYQTGSKAAVLRRQGLQSVHGRRFVNKYLQSWDVPNVFVVGASAFPQNSANPPTLTVGALACWTADAIKDEYLPRPRPLA